MDTPPYKLRFGPYEADPETGELRKHGVRIKLATQSFQILLLLAGRSGELITREDIRAALWPHETVAEWEHSINTAIRRIRAALGDAADSPRYVETLPRRGYRFLAQVERVAAASVRVAPAPASTVAQGPADRSDPVGQTLSHYRVLALLGRGGMGVVYRGEDTVLGRPVALKFLHPDLESDSTAVERFQREARTASSLNHPNICTIYEVEVFRGRVFLAMELLEGETLRDRIARSIVQPQAQPPFPSDSLLDLAIQVAGALEAAHERGIIHRDIKPANIFLIRGGAVKVLDFGLAKAAPRRLPDGSTLTAAPGAATDRLTSTGITPGTIAYMSPEQKRGEDLDARTDLYSFGAVLCEAATGQHTPEQFDAGRLPPSLAARHPAKLWEIVGRLLDPDRAMRYQTAGDVASELKRLKRDISSAPRPPLPAAPADTAPAPAASQRRAGRWRYQRVAAQVAVAFALPLMAVAVYVFLHFRPEPRLGPLLVQPLTGMSGLEDDPVFSPNGKRVAFSLQTGGGSVAHIHVKLIGGGPPLALTSGPVFDISPAWSPDEGSIAFVREEPAPRELCLVPALGGAVRQVTSILPAAPDRGSRDISWSPDGSALLISDRGAAREPAAIFLLFLKTGEKRKLTSPPADAYGDGSPEASPDGKTLAFIRWVRNSVSDIYLQPLADGSPRRLTNDGKRLAGFAWSADSHSIVFSSRRGALPGLWRIPAGGGTPEPLAGAGEDAVTPAIAHEGNLLAYAYQFENINLWRFPGRPTPPSRTPAMLAPSPRQDVSGVYSPDGKRIAFSSDRSGSYEIWVSDSDGSHQQQLTSFRGPVTGTPHWSPDGKWITFDSRPGGHSAVFAIGSEGGEPRQLTDGQFDDIVPSWSHDGKWIYFSSNRGGGSQLFRIAAAGGKPIQVTRKGGFEAAESPDGAWLYYSKDSAPGIWRMPLPGGEEEPVWQGFTSRFWTIAPDGLVFLDFGAKPRRTLSVLDVSTRRVKRLATPAGEVAWGYSGLSVSPDGQWLLYAQLDRLVSQINLVENFR